MFCYGCGKSLEDGVKFCTECGTRVPIEGETNGVVNSVSPTVRTVVTKQPDKINENEFFSINIIVSYILGAVMLMVICVASDDFVRMEFPAKIGISTLLVCAFFIIMGIIIMPKSGCKNSKTIAVLINLALVAFCIFLVFNK